MAAAPVLEDLPSGVWLRHRPQRLPSLERPRVAGILIMWPEHGGHCPANVSAAGIRALSA